MTTIWDDLEALTRPGVELDWPRLQYLIDAAIKLGRGRPEIGDSIVQVIGRQDGAPIHRMIGRVQASSFHDETAVCEMYNAPDMYRRTVPHTGLAKVAEFRLWEIK